MYCFLCRLPHPSLSGLCIHNPGSLFASSFTDRFRFATLVFAVCSAVVSPSSHRTHPQLFCFCRRFLVWLIIRITAPPPSFPTATNTNIREICNTSFTVRVRRPLLLSPLPSPAFSLRHPSPLYSATVYVCSCDIKLNRYCYRCIGARSGCVLV